MLHQLSKTLFGRVTEHFLIAKTLDSRVVAADLRQQRPLPAKRLPEVESGIYEQMLDEVVRYLVEVASVLPRSETIVEKESLTRLSHLGSDVAEVLTTVRQFEARVVKPGAGRAARFEFDYRTAVVRELDRVELFGADIPPENQRNLLSDAFVTLNVDRRWKNEEAKFDGDTAKNPSPQSGVLTCNELFDSLAPESPTILIRGSAGSGKTTLLRWASLEAAGTLAKGEQTVSTRSRKIPSGREFELNIVWNSIRGEFDTRHTLTKE